MPTRRNKIKSEMKGPDEHTPPPSPVDAAQAKTVQAIMHCGSSGYFPPEDEW